MAVTDGIITRDLEDVFDDDAAGDYEGDPFRESADA